MRTGTARRSTARGANVRNDCVTRAWMAWSWNVRCVPSARPDGRRPDPGGVVDYNSRVDESKRLRFNPRVQRMEGNPNDVKAAQDLAVEQAARA